MLKVRIVKMRSGSQFAVVMNGLVLFEFRRDPYRWLFWTRTNYDPEIMNTKDFPLQFFIDACRARAFIVLGGKMPESVEITKGGEYFGIK